MDENNLSLPSSSTLVLRPQLVSDGQVVHLKLKKPKNNHKQVRWDVHAIDNENLNKKKSKCCCIYQKPKKCEETDRNESNESDNDECDSCVGKKKTHKFHRNNNQKEEQNEEPKEDN